MMKFLLALLIPVFAWGSADTINNATVFTGGKVYKNYILNSNCDYGLTGLTTTSTSGLLTKSSNLSGQSVCSWAPAATGKTVTIKMSPIGTDLNGSQCAATFDAASGTGGAVTYKAELQYDGVVKDSIADLAVLGSYTTFRLTYPCPGSFVTAFNVVLTSTSSSPGTLVWRNAHFGKTEISQQSVNGVTQSYTPVWAAAASTQPAIGNGTITGQHKREGAYDNIQINITSGTTTTYGTSSGWIFSLPTGELVDTTQQAIDGSGVVQSQAFAIATATLNQYSGIVSVYGTTKSDVLVQTTGASTNQHWSNVAPATWAATTAGQKIQLNFRVPIQGWLSSAAVTSDQTDYGWTSYTPTFTGFGTVTNIDCKHRRDSEEVVLKCKFTAGTTTSTEARMSLPPGLTSVSTIPTLSSAGPFFKGFTSTLIYGYGTVLIEPSVSYVTFGEADSTNNPMAKATATVFGNNGLFDFSNIRIPIAGWNANGRAQAVAGGVRTNDPNTPSLILYAKITGSASTPTISSQSGTWLSSITRNAQGNYTAVPVTSFFSTAPYCWSRCYDNTVGTAPNAGAANSTTAITVNCTSLSSGFPGNDCNRELFCLAPQ